MLIKDMFKKPIDRDIKGVIVVGEGEDSNAKQELEEYVVTRELSKHFREFFDNYKKGIVGETTKTGVWISGFFGSGKSHFLKILSYLLDGQMFRIRNLSIAPSKGSLQIIMQLRKSLQRSNTVKLFCYLISRRITCGTLFAQGFAKTKQT